MPDPAEIIASCKNVLPGHGQRQPIAVQLRQLADDLAGDEYPDVYGSGDYLAAFEQEVAGMFGKEAAVFMPSGTMAQQIALRIWCERSGNLTVAMHPTAHLETAEQSGYQFLHGIRRLQFGGPGPEMIADRLVEAQDFEQLGELPGAVLLELPCRPLGGQLPPWDDLVATRDWTSSHNIPLHLDGARIWQCRGYYGKTFQEIADLFDSVYVSFYKDVGGLCGCMLMGPNDFIKASRVWQRRYGGNLYTQGPYVASARIAMNRTLPLMDAWNARAKEVAAVLASHPKVRVNPDPPHVNFFRIYVEGDHEALNARHLELAGETGTYVFPNLRPSPVPGIATGELHLWENAIAFDLDKLAPFLEQLFD